MTRTQGRTPHEGWVVLPQAKALSEAKRGALEQIASQLLWRERGPANTSTSGVQPPELGDNPFLLFTPLRLWYLVEAALALSHRKQLVLPSGKVLPYRNRKRVQGRKQPMTGTVWKLMELLKSTRDTPGNLPK